MFKSIFLYEVKYWLSKPPVYLYFITFFTIAFLVFIGSAGFFDPPYGGSKLQQYVNSPYEFNYLLQYFNKFFLFLLPAIMGASIYKDFKDNAHSVLYTFPIKKGDYFLGKFLASFLVVILITLSVVAAMLVAEQVPGLDPAKMGPFNFSGYVQAYFLYTIPNMLFYGMVVFATVAVSRNIYAGFVAVILLFFIQTITENALSGFLIGLFDPFAQNASKYVTQFWTLVDKNTLSIPVLGTVLYNRLLWLGITTSIFGLAYKKFKFSEAPITFFIKKQTKQVTKKISRIGLKWISPIEVNYDFSFSQELKTAWRLSGFNLAYIVKSWMFAIITFFGLLAVLFAIGKVTNQDEMALLPITGLMLTIPAFFFSTIIMLLTFIYSGMLVHRERTANVDQLVDITPVSNWVLLGSKVLALIKMQSLLLLIMMLAGIIIQLYNGYYAFEIDLYLLHLYGLLFIVLIIWAFTSVFVHTLFTNAYVGIFVLLIGWMGISSLDQIGVTTKLLFFNSPGLLNYSSLNAYDNKLLGYFLIEGYWFVFGALLLLISYLLWYRGFPGSLFNRLSMAKIRFRGPTQIMASVLFTVFIALGFTIYTEESQLIVMSNKEQNHALEAFKTDFEGFAGMPQPRITRAKLKIDIFPKTNDFKGEGRYTLINKSSKKIDTLLIKMGFDELSSFSLDRDYELVSESKNFKFSVVKLVNSLSPSDSLYLSFKMENVPNSMFERNSSVLDNGTFLNVDILPRIGYFLNEEKMQPTDSLALKNHFQAIDSDLVNFETTISTIEGQTAIAPGYLQKEWKENGRHYFHYKMDSDIKFSFSANSGRFSLQKEKWKGVDLMIYHHKGHNRSLNNMMGGLKAAIDYNTESFGPYQHREARIIEFPLSEGTFATTMANSIPISEIRFVANTEISEGKIDVAFYVAAHELTHQWWGAQVIGANALGGRFLSESTTDYFTYKMYQKQFGEAEGLRWLKLQRSRYLDGRTNSQEEEPPLMLVDEQRHIFYGKGTMAFNTLGHYLGEDKLNSVMRDFLIDYKFKGAPYPTSLELVRRLKEKTPDSLQYIIKDMFETVTFYDAKIVNAESYMIEEGYQIKLDAAISKYRNSKDGKSYLPLSDYIEIGVYDENDVLIYSEKHKVTTSECNISIQVKDKPYKIVIDSNFLLIEKEINDNEFEL